MKNFLLQNQCHPLLISVLENAGEGITISDATAPDNPLVYANEGFLNITGYADHEIKGRNCRFLQGPLTGESCIQEMRDGISSKKMFHTEILNYKKDGTTFWNRLLLFPFCNDAGEVTNWIGIQEDITVQKEKKRLQANLVMEKLISHTRLESEKAERHRLGMELHDNVNQMLVAVRLYLSMAEKMPHVIDTAKGLIDDTISELRVLAAEMVGEKKPSTPLNKALNELIDSVGIFTQFKLVKELDIPDDLILDDFKHLVIVRVVQEQLVNIQKHALASEVRICCGISDGHVLLTITDNGKGFCTSQPSNGIGLRNMLSRIEKENGTLNITSSVGNGCSLEVRMKLESTEKAKIKNSSHQFLKIEACFLERHPDESHTLLKNHPRPAIPRVHLPYTESHI